MEANSDESQEVPDYVAFHYLRGVDLPPEAVTARWLRDAVATLFESYPSSGSSLERRVEFLEGVYPIVIKAVFDLDKKLAERRHDGR